MNLDSAIVLIIVSAFYIWQHFKIRKYQKYVLTFDDAVATYKRERDNLVKVNNDLMLALADIKAMNEDVTKQAEEFFKKYQGK